jgi:hypothetical protein
VSNVNKAADKGTQGETEVWTEHFSLSIALEATFRSKFDDCHSRRVVFWVLVGASLTQARAMTSPRLEIGHQVCLVCITHILEDEIIHFY